MKMKHFLWLTAVAVLLPLSAAEPETERTIRLIQDDGQVRFATKLYELKYVKATDIRPYVEGAIKRYSKNSVVERVNNPLEKKNYIVVTTGEDFLPYVDEMIRMIDRPGKTDEFGSVIAGTGVTQITYEPRYRTGQDIVNIINICLRSNVGLAYWDEESNMIYWKDDRGAALSILAWVKYLDRPLPQARIRVTCYEVRESALRDLGLDYLAWKNGPGLNLFEAAYNSGRIISDETLLQLIGGAAQFLDVAKNFSSSWDCGGFFTAPQFDLSFLRLLQQSGNATLLTRSDLVVVNTPFYELPEEMPDRRYTLQLLPEYQNLHKDATDRTFIDSSVFGSAFTLTVKNPVVCFDGAASDPAGHLPSTVEYYKQNKGKVLFDFSLVSRDVMERSNRGEELGSQFNLDGSMTLATGTEKLLTSYIRENDVEQTVGIPFLVKIPVLKYLFGTTTTLRERTCIIITAEATLVHPENGKETK